MTNATLALNLRTVEIQSEPKDNPVVGGQFSACGNYLAILRRNQAVCVYNLEEETKIELDSIDLARAVAFHPFEPELSVAVTGKVPRIERFDLRCPKFKARPFEMIPANCLAYNNMGDLLVAGQSNGFLTLFDLDSTPCPTTIFNRRIVLEGITAVSLKDEKIVGATEGGQTFKYDLETTDKKRLAAISKRAELEGDCYALVMHPYVDRSVFAGSGPYVRVIEGVAQRPRVLATRFGYIYQLRFMPELRQIAIVGDKGVEVWSTIDWQIIYHWDVPHGQVACTTQMDERLVIAWG